MKSREHFGGRYAVPAVCGLVNFQAFERQGGCWLWVDLTQKVIDEAADSLRITSNRDEVGF